MANFTASGHREFILSLGYLSDDPGRLSNASVWKYFSNPFGYAWWQETRDEQWVDAPLNAAAIEAQMNSLGPEHRICPPGGCSLSETGWRPSRNRAKHRDEADQRMHRWVSMPKKHERFGVTRFRERIDLRSVLQTRRASQEELCKFHLICGARLVEHALQVRPRGRDGDAQ